MFKLNIDNESFVGVYTTNTDAVGYNIIAYFCDENNPKVALVLMSDSEETKKGELVMDFMHPCTTDYWIKLESYKEITFE